MNIVTGIDHIAIQVRDLDATVAAYTAIFGRTPNWRGRAGDVRHVWFQFKTMALDVIGSDGDTPGAEAIRADLENHGEGIWGLGFTVADLEDAKHRLTRRGVALMDTHITRSVSENGEERTWTLAIARRKATHGPALFFVQEKETNWPVAPANDDAAVSGLDHIVIQTQSIERALALYGARLGLNLRLDRVNEQWGAHQLFFRCGNSVVEIGASLKTPPSDAPDKFAGLAWRIADPQATHARVQAAGLDVSEIREGRKPGTSVFTVRNGTGGVPTLMLSGNAE
jgi:catechol 2,3-dioxygenase-like lactoylglutathione lyase family enzyme